MGPQILLTFWSDYTTWRRGHEVRVRVFPGLVRPKPCQQIFVAFPQPRNLEMSRLECTFEGPWKVWRCSWVRDRAPAGPQPGEHYEHQQHQRAMWRLPGR